MKITDLPPPEVIEEIGFEAIVARKIDRFKEIAASKGIEYIPSPSDDIVTALEVLAYEEMLLRERINNAVKSGLLAFAKGSDLDHIGVTRFGVTRLAGAKPYANFTFTLSSAFGYDITLPKGLILGNDKNDRAFLLDDVVIAAGSLSSDGTAELDAFVETSDAKTEMILTPLPYLVEAQQNTAFEGGENPEDDERFRERIWLSRERKSTAGSRMMYRYYALSADSRVQDVAIIEDTAGVVKIYLLGDNGAADSVMIDRVSAELDKEEVRPLTDKVEVYSATVTDVTIDAQLVLYDLSLQNDVQSLVEERFAKNTMIFGKELSLAKIYGLLESESVADVVLNAPTASIPCADNEVLRATLVISYSEVV